MLDQHFNLFHFSAQQLLTLIHEQHIKTEYNFQKHCIEFASNQGENIGYIRLPLHLSISEKLTLIDEEINVIYISIESDNAAICVVEDKEITYHTTFSSYMTRRKQGYSQIKHLNKKGKSRAGSRVRLASTYEFFENINECLIELLDDYIIDRIALSCSTSLLPYMYESKTPCPFNKTDDRLYKIPLHIAQSNFTNLEQTIKKLNAPILFYNKEHQVDFNFLLQDEA